MIKYLLLEQEIRLAVPVCSFKSLLKMCSFKALFTDREWSRTVIELIQNKMVFLVSCDSDNTHVGWLGVPHSFET